MDEPTADVNIRPACLEDAATLAAIHVYTWQVAYQGLIAADYLASLSVAQRRTRWEERLRTHPDDTLVCAAGQQPVGFVVLGPARSEDELPSGTGEVYALYLAPEYWGRGAGRQLMTAALDELRRRGYSAAIVWVLRDNLRARRFYERTGFVIDGVEKVERIGEDDLAHVRYWMAL
jgi:ribosomal protein S18 acetylase RimI-like enzyme